MKSVKKKNHGDPAGSQRRHSSTLQMAAFLESFLDFSDGTGFAKSLISMLEAGHWAPLPMAVRTDSAVWVRRNSETRRYV